MLNIPARIDSVTGMLSVLHLLRNLAGSWGCKTALNAHQSDGTIPLDGATILVWGSVDPRLF
jgi:hypothetical protein